MTEQLVVFVWRRKLGAQAKLSHALAPTATLTAMCGTSTAKAEFWAPEHPDQQRCRKCIEAIGINYPSSVSSAVAAPADPISVPEIAERLFGGRVDLSQEPGSILHRSIVHAFESGALAATTGEWAMVEQSKPAGIGAAWAVTSMPLGSGIAAVASREHWRGQAGAAGLDLDVFDEMVRNGYDPRRAYGDLLIVENLATDPLGQVLDCCVPTCNACPVCYLHDGFHSDSTHDSKRVIPAHLLIPTARQRREATRA